MKIKNSKLFFLLFVIFITLLIIALRLFYHILPYKSSCFLMKEDKTTQFAVDEKKYDRTGLVYHYIKTDMQNHNRADVWTYYLDPFHSETFKIYPFSKFQKATDLICAEYDKESFQTLSLDAYLIDLYGQRKLNATLSLSEDLLLISNGKKMQTVKLGVIPSYNLNFDWTDLNSMFPFLKKTDDDITFGFIALDSFARFHYSGVINCVFCGCDEYSGELCSVFQINSIDYPEKSGRIWVNPSNMDMVAIETDHSGNPLYGSLKFKLSDKQKMSYDQWNAFITEKTKEVLE